MAREVETSVHSFEEIHGASRAMLAALRGESPLTERALMRCLDQQRAVVILAGALLEKEQLIAVDPDGEERTFHLSHQSLG
jgi:hypothetical protein